MAIQFKAGVVGNHWSQSSLARGITRQRGKCGTGSPKFAKLLGEKLQQLADKRWARAIKGQRGPTPKQALALVSAVDNALVSTQSRCQARTIDAQTVIVTARDAAAAGRATRDGGKVTCGSYGYAWTTTTASGERQADGAIRVTVCRTGSVSISAPAKHWESISAASDVLAGGGIFAIRRAHGWDCYSATSLVGVAIPVTDAAVKSRWGQWEHGKTVAEAQAEIVRKQAILAAEKIETDRRNAEANLRQIAAEAEAAKQQRIDRAARLLARIGTKTTVGYDDARAVGACDAGLKAFAERIGLPLDSRLTLADVCKLEPTWAVKLARRIVVSQKA